MQDLFLFYVPQTIWEFDFMTLHPYLIYNLEDHLYGLSSLAVEEIFFLPELTPIPEAPEDLVGVVNVRGELLPVMDINRRFGYQSSDYSLSDSVVVVKLDDVRVGLIVNQVLEVRNIDSEDIIQELSLGRNLTGIDEHKFIFTEGIAKTQEDIILILNPENLLKYIQRQQLTNEDDDSSEPERQKSRESFALKPVFCPHASPEEKAIFKQRARELRQKAETEDVTTLKPLAVISLNNEFFAVDLSLVREFTELQKITPIPCCPSHIVGNINLRGEIVTLIDLRGLLNLPPKEITNVTKAMVIQVEDIVGGIVVEDVSDVMFLNPREITSIPTAIATVNEEYLLGAAAYHQKMMTILDLSKILLNGNLVVEETV